MSTDLLLTNRTAGSQTSDRWGVDLQVARGDLQQASGRANLTQAILNRLFTRQGELAGLGHPDYGSRLYQLVGEPNSRHTQAVAELYIRESLALEPRIRAIVSISFAPPSLRADKRDQLEITLLIKPVDDDTPLNLAIQVPL